MHDPIAIVGASCRYPDAEDIDQLWEVAMSGRRAFRPIPRARLNLDDYSSDAAGQADGTYAKFAAVIEGWSFDRAKFRVPGSVYRVTDPTHWLALEMAADALMAAGYPEGRGLVRDRVGVVVGNTMNGEFSRAGGLRLRWPYVRRLLQRALSEEGWDQKRQARFITDFEQVFKAPFPEPNDETLAGGLSNTIAGRICNHFDFHGGGYTVDGACSSSLLAVITAAKALRAGEIDVAIAGGVDLSLDPFELVGFARTGALATTDMRVYDARPTGFWPGEGCGMVILMRAQDALAAGRTPLALIKGWGVSSDGRGGITRPEKNGQLLAVLRAYEQAGFGPESVAFFEGHGTGTAVGDQVEIATLIEAQGGRRVMSPAALGSIKANIGHTKAAAGIAGLLKASMALHRQVIPPTTGCEEPHESLSRAGAPLRVVPTAETWPEEVPLRAGVSAMGFGGINTHVVLEGVAPRRNPTFTLKESRLARRPLDAEVFAFAADTREDLLAQLERVQEIAARISLAERADLAAALAESGAGSPREFRAGIVAASAAQLAQRAAQAARLLVGHEDDGFFTAPGVAVGIGAAGRLGLVFTGQGAPVPPGPGALGVILPGLHDLFAGDSNVLASTDTAVAQPAIVKASMAGLRWLQRLGVVADGAVGHSLGEITALHWAGALGERQTLELAEARGRIMGLYGVARTGMLSVAADRDLTLQLIDGTDLVIAADHGHAHVVAGPVTDVDRVVRRCEQRDIRIRRLNVSHGFHSPAFRPAEPDLERYLRGVTFERPIRPVYSTITGRRMEDPADLPSLLTAQLTSPVLFRQAVSALAEVSDLLVEVGPGHTLAPLAGELGGLPALSLDVGSRSSVALSQVAAALHALGVASELRSLYSARFHRDFDLWHDPQFLENPCEQAPTSDPLPTVAAPAVEAAEVTADPALDPGDVVRGMVALALELPAEAIGEEDRLLSDLHLNSLRVVQLAEQAAAACGRAMPVEPLVVADVSVAELAEYVAALPPAGEDEAEGPNIPGVAPWHRLLLPSLKPAHLTDERVSITWRVWGGGPLRSELAPKLDTDDWRPEAELVFLPENPSDDDISTLVDVARTAVEERRPLTVVDHGDTATGFLATIRQEHAHQRVRWIGAGAGTAEAVHQLLHLPLDRYPELVLNDEGKACTIDYAPLSPPAEGDLPLGPQDLVLVTGGGKGIGYQTALALGRLTACELVLLGRSDPEDDDELRANLDALGAAGVRYTYTSADVADRASVQRAISAVSGAHGPVRALIHSSGINLPARFLDLEPGDYLGHAAPKHHGLREILSCLDTEQLRLVVTYGSVIGRFGLPGEAHYALANGRLRELARTLARDLPTCRVLNIDWTAWSGAGMGTRLGVLDSLLRSGVVPVPVDKGIDLLRHLLSSPIPGPAVVATGRLPHLQSEDAAGVAMYAHRIRTLVPGVELIAEADLDLQRHPYLADHQIDGLTLLPAVCAMEAMAEAAAMVSGRAIGGLVDCRFHRPVILPEDSSRTIRVCALVGESGEIDLVVRSDESGYAVDHFSARVEYAPSSPLVDVTVGSGLSLPVHDGHSLYGQIFFHGPTFQRLRGYEHLEATGCVAVLDAAPRWALGGSSVLGDPTLNDATIHVLQACVPNRRLLPIGCDAFSVDTGTTAAGEFVLSAVERAREGVEHVYDVAIRDSRGARVMCWRGLRLRDIGPLELASWPPVLLGPYLQRSMEALLPASPVHVHVSPKTGGRTQSRTSNFAQATARSHLDTWVLGVGGPAALACDWEWVGATGAGEPHAPSLRGQREQIALLTGEPDSHTLTRLWTVRECLSKRGQAMAQAPLTVQGVFEQGWVLLRSGSAQIASTVVRVEGSARPIAVAVMVKGGS